MRQHLEEAVFSRAAVVVEGPTDAAFLAGLADRRDGLDAAGIALVPAGGKNHLLLPWAILEELGVPTYLVFDGDADIRNRFSGTGRVMKRLPPPQLRLKWTTVESSLP